MFRPSRFAPAGTQLFVQHHGNMHMDGRRMAGVPSYFQSASQRSPKDMWVPLPCLTFLVKHQAGVFLFDLGCCKDWKTSWWPTGIGEMVPYDDWTPEQEFETTLRRNGLSVSDIDVVVLSHLHMDHCGNLELFDRTRAKIIIQQAELDEAMRIDAPGRGGYVTSQYRDFHLNWQAIEGDKDLVAGIDLLFLPGHSPGSQGMAVNLAESGLLVLASDAAQVAANLDGHCSPNVYDSIRWRQSIEQLKRLRTEHDAFIICGHEHSQLANLKLSPEFYK